MNSSKDNKFGPPIRISQIMDGRPWGGMEAIPGPDIAVIVAQYWPAYKDTTHDYFVRNVKVSRTSITREDKGRMYRWCIFPDGRTMLVNEGNIRSKPIKKGYAA